MKLSELKKCLENASSLSFRLHNGENIPNHFHLTEAGLATKHFIDCGGTVRIEKNISLQLWYSDDYDHRLSTTKLKKILDASLPLFGSEDLDIVIEYQSDTIGLYDLDYDGNAFVLQSKYTTCLAKDNCGIPTEKPKLNLSALPIVQSSCCDPNSNCC